MLKFLDENFNDMINFTRELIKINSVNGNEREVAEAIKEKLKKYGIKSRLFGKGDRKGLVAEIGKGKRPIILNGHLDTVSVGDVRRGW